MRYVCMMLACLLMVGCQEEEKWGTGATSGFQISLQDAAVGVETKSTPEELGEPLKTNFKIKVVKQSTGESETYNYKDNLVIPASAGTYDIIASYGDNPVLASDVPYYEGTAEDQKIEEDATEPVPVKIDCKVANALASVEFLTSDTEMKKKYDYYALRVKVENQSIDLTSTKKSSAYFRNGAAVSLFFAYTTKGGTGKEEQEFKDGKFTAEKGKHYIIKLKMEDDASMKIEKKEVEEVTINETIPMEWLPAPSVSATGFDLETKILDVYETAAQKDASIDFTVNQMEGLEDLEFTLNFQDEAFASLNGSYTLSGMDDAAKAKFADAGITLPTISQTTPKLQFSSSFLSTLKAKNEGNVVNTITINKVIANGRENKDGEQTYTINTHKPEFTVEVLSGNVWSKTFTAEEITVAEGKGDLETIKKNLVYQYQDADGSWKDFSNQTKREQAFAEHPENLDYKVRAVYKEDDRELYSVNEDEVELEIPMQLANSGMEEWSTERGEEFRVSDSWSSKKTYYKFYPYEPGENNIWWATNNQRSQDGNIVLGLGHPVAFSPCVSYSESVKHKDSRSALIYTSGHGGGSTSTAEALYTNGAIAGNMFIGQYSWNDNKENISKGHTFEVRPTAFEFWYNYIPKNSDSFKVYIELKNGEEIIVSGEFIPTASSAGSGWQKGIISLKNYIIPTKKATSIYVQFLSTTKTSFSSNDFDKNKSITFPVMGDWNAHMGSMLYIDDLNLVFDK